MREAVFSLDPLHIGTSLIGRHVEHRSPGVAPATATGEPAGSPVDDRDQCERGSLPRRATASVQMVLTRQAPEAKQISIPDLQRSRHKVVFAK